MKTKLLTLAFFGLMTISMMGCNKEEIAPASDVALEQSWGDCECEGGLSDREKPGGR